MGGEKLLKLIDKTFVKFIHLMKKSRSKAPIDKRIYHIHSFMCVCPTYSNTVTGNWDNLVKITKLKQVGNVSSPVINLATKATVGTTKRDSFHHRARIPLAERIWKCSRRRNKARHMSIEQRNSTITLNTSSASILRNIAIAYRNEQLALVFIVLRFFLVRYWVWMRNYWDVNAGKLLGLHLVRVVYDWGRLLKRAGKCGW